MKAHCLIVAFLVGITTIAQPRKVLRDTAQATPYMQKADSLLADRKFDSAQLYYKKALPIYQKAVAWAAVARTYNGIAECQWRGTDDSIALKTAKKALEVAKIHLSPTHKEIAKAYENIAEYYYFTLVDYKGAIQYYEQAMAVYQQLYGEKHLSIANLYSSIGASYLALVQNDEALENLQQALEIFDALDAKNVLERAHTFTSLSRVYYNTGYFEKALQAQQESLSIMLHIHGKNHLEVGYQYNDIALSYSYLGKVDESFEYYKKCLTILTTLKETNKSTVSHVYNNIGVSYKSTENYSLALEYYKKALDVVKEVNDDEMNSLLFNNIGFVYAKLQTHDSAIYYCRRSLKIREQLHPMDSPYIAASKAYLGYAYEQSGVYDKALSYYKQTLAAYTKHFGERDIYVADIYNDMASVAFKKQQFKLAIDYYTMALVANTKKNLQKGSHFNDYLEHENLLISLEGKGRAERELYQSEKKPIYLQHSIETYAHAEVLIDEIRRSLSHRNNKILLAKRTKAIYAEAISTQLASYTYAKDQTTIEKAFYYAEKSKANILKELLKESNAKSFAGLPDDLVTLEKKLRIDKAHYKSKLESALLDKAIDSTQLMYCESQLFDISRSQDSLLQLLEKNHPKYHQLKYDDRVISVAEIQQQLAEDTTVLTYFTKDSTTYAFTISKEAIGVQALATPNLAQKVARFRKAVLEKNTRIYKQIAHELYTILIAPIRQQFVGDELLIVPDGALWHLNFDLLVSTIDSSNSPQQLSYLIKEYAITYANSATLFFADAASAVRPSRYKEACLAFSFSDSTYVSPKKMSLATLRATSDDLPGTRKEIKSIASIIDGDYFYGSEAGEANFKKHAADYGILHLALHGAIDDEHPEKSKLFFTQTKDTVEDNLLYAHELFALDIPAELTVLSACNTGIGKIAKGEGIMSLGTAFQYAGSKSLVLSSWEVSDQTAPKLMESFYTHLKSGKNKAKALQQAKLEYLETAAVHRTHPFYWGGFYLIGDTAPIAFGRAPYVYWSFGIGVLVIILLSLLWYRKRFKQ